MLLLLTVWTALADTAETGPWTHGRWAVQAEAGVPLSLQFDALTDAVTRSTALQVQAVLDCAERGRKKDKVQVACVIEQVGLQASVPGRVRPESVDAAMTTLDEALTGATLAFTSSPDRAVQGLAVEAALDKDQRDIVSLVAAELIRGFDLAVPPADASSWKERRSRLAELPVQVPARSSARIEHTRGPDGEVRTTGTGTVDISAHLVYADPVNRQDDRAGAVAPGPGAQAGPAGSPTPLTRFARDEDLAEAVSAQGGLRDFGALPTDEIPPRALFETHLSARSHFDGTALVERMWVLTAMPTPDSVTSAPGWSVGHIQRLSASDAFDVGPTRAVGVPGGQDGRVARFTSLADPT